MLKKKQPGTIDLNKLLREVRNARQTSERLVHTEKYAASQKKSFENLTKKRTLLLPITVTILVVVLASVLIWSTTNRATNCETDKTCFIAIANQCSKARMTSTIAGAEFILSTNKCTLTKTLTALAEKEPIAVKQALQGKSMTCTYEQNSFDDTYLTTITAHLDKCSGELKTALEIIRIGQ